MKIYELIKIREELVSLSKNNLKLRSSFNIAKFLSLTEKDAQFFQDKVVELIQKYGARDTSGQFILENNGSSVQIQQKYLDECQRGLNEINNYEIEVPELKIYYTDLPEGLSVTTLFTIIDYILEE